jgi:magnesium-protoporphyrin O-methyltransferase
MRSSESAFDRISEFVSLKPDSRILDAGCGTCNHSIRLAKQGYRVRAVDLSELVLEKARGKIASENLSNYYR